jgi:hypothetical protein
MNSQDDDEDVFMEVETQNIRMFSIEQALKICEDYKGMTHKKYMQNLLATASRLEAYVCYRPDKPEPPKPPCEIVPMNGEKSKIDWREPK